MKVTGTKNLANILTPIMQGIFVIGIVLFIFLPLLIHYLVTIWKVDLECLKIPSLLVFYPTGLCVLVIVYQLIGLFRSLKEDNPFTVKTVKRLRNCWIASTIIAMIYGIVFIATVFTKNIPFIVFSSIITGVFVVVAMAMYLLAGLFEKANQYKEENELTI